MKDVTLYCEAHYFEDIPAGYAGYILEFNGKFKTFTTITFLINVDVMLLDTLYLALQTRKEPCNLTVYTKVVMPLGRLSKGEGADLVKRINALVSEKRHKLCFKQATTAQDTFYLDGITEALLKEKKQFKREKLF